MALSPIKEKYTELVTFFQWLFATYLPDAEIFLEGQNAPRPENPYISFNPIVDIEYIGNDETRMKSDGTEYLRGQRNLHAVVYGFSDSETRYNDEDNAWEMLQEVRFALGYPAVREQMTNISCRVVDEGIVVNTSETLNTTNEPRAMLQILFSTVILQPIDNGEIATVNAEGTFTGATGDIISNVSVTKP